MAVNGPAVGIGASYALAGDIVLAAESSYFLLSFAAIGLVPDGGASCLFPARVGSGRFNRLAMLGERVPANRALEYGLVDQVTSEATLRDSALELADRLAAGPTGAYTAVKSLINADALSGLDAALDLEAQLQGRQVDTEEFDRGLAAFASSKR